MLSREDFVFTIGYDGPVAVVDSQAKQRYGSLSTRELAEKGFFRAAYASAVYAHNQEEVKLVTEIYHHIAGAGYEEKTVDAPLDRLFGVFPVEVQRSIAL
ncbi:MAG: hypothetical protein LBQ30_10780 [Treponema sp.]|jgi:hypothetical protein|nr:hypothetical protein [Treponema sp.]